MRYVEIAVNNLDNHLVEIEKLVSYIQNEDIRFELKLSLSEGVVNAYIHGNDSDANKKIYIRMYLYKEKAVFEIEDSGSGIVRIDEINKNEDLLQESGRGLFLIESLCDLVKYDKNILKMEKSLLI